MSDDVILKLSIIDAEKIFGIIVNDDMCIFSTPFKLLMKKLENEIRKYHGNYTLGIGMIGETEIFRILKGGVDTGSFCRTESSAYDIINTWRKYERENESRKEIVDGN